MPHPHPKLDVPRLITPGAEPPCDRPGPDGERCQRPKDHTTDLCAAVGLQGPADAPLADREAVVVTWLYDHGPAIGRVPAPHHWEQKVTRDSTDFSAAEWSTLTLYAAAVDQRFGVDGLGAVYCPDPDHGSFLLTRGRPSMTPMSDLLVWTREHWECRNASGAVPVHDVENVER